jgi:hypothetical protein
LSLLCSCSSLLLSLFLHFFFLLFVNRGARLSRGSLCTSECRLFLFLLNSAGFFFCGSFGNRILNWLLWFDIAELIWLEVQVFQNKGS